MTTMNINKFDLDNLKADRHRGNDADWLEKHERLCNVAVRKGTDAINTLTSYLFERAADTRNLSMAWEHVRKKSGRTAGPDGRTCEQFTKHDRFDYLRSLSRDILDGHYRIERVRHVRVPKRSGGWRIISVPNMEDRVVQRAIVQVVQPLLDGLFDVRSFGFRPNRSRFDALACAERFTLGGRRVWLMQDLRDAFGSVPLSRLMQVVKKYLRCPQLAHLIQCAITVEDTPGLIQGGALSPLLLNLYCHHLLDLPWRRFGLRAPPLIRYADNLLVACVSEAGADRARHHLNKLLLAAGFRLKIPSNGDATLRNLTAGMTAPWLGFDVVLRDGELRYEIPALAMDQLSDGLRLGDPRSVAIGWFREMGPTYPHMRRDDVFREVFEIANGFELPLHELYGELKEHWRQGWRNWRRLSL